MNIQRFWQAIEDEHATEVEVFFGDQAVNWLIKDIAKLDEGRTAEWKKPLNTGGERFSLVKGVPAQEDKSKETEMTDKNKSSDGFFSKIEDSKLVRIVVSQWPDGARQTTTDTIVMIVPTEATVSDVVKKAEAEYGEDAEVLEVTTLYDGDILEAK